MPALLLVLAFFLGISPALAQGNSAVAQRLVSLSNGLSVLIVPDHRFPIVCTRLYVHAGSAYETPSQAGISHVLEHMVFKGTKSRPGSSISQEVESAGGYLNAATSHDYTVYITDMPSRSWQLGLDAVHDMAFNATLDTADLEAEKNVVISEMKQGDDTPHGLLFKKLLASTLRGTAYEHPIIGYEDTVRAITPANLHDYIAKLYQPRNMLLTVVGDIDPDVVLAEGERLFGQHTNSTSLDCPSAMDAASLPPTNGTVPNSEKTPVVPSVIVEKGPWNKVYLAAALPVPGTAALSSAPLDVLAHLLGGDETGLLIRKFKHERQLVEDISVSNYGFERIGIFLVLAELQSDKVATFWDEFTAFCAGLHAEAFTPQEIDRARLNLEDDLFRARETLSGMTSKLGHFHFFHGPQGENNVREAIRNVDTPALKRALDDWFRPERLETVVLIPENANVTDLEQKLHKSLSRNWPGNEKRKQDASNQNGAQEIVRLENGGTVILLPDSTLPYMSLNLTLSGGDALLQPTEQGLAALTARVLSSETRSLNTTDLNAFLAERAASLKATAGRDTFSINLTCPSRFTSDLQKLLLEILQDPPFSITECARNIQEQIAAISSREDRPLGLVFRKLNAFLFPEGRNGYLQLGEASTLEGFTRKDIAAFWERQKKGRWVLAAAGQFDRNEVLALARTLPLAGDTAVARENVRWTQEKKLIIPLQKRNQAHLLLVFPTAPKDSMDTPALMVMSESLAGMGGPLFRDLRDKQGLGYTVTAFHRQTNDYGMLIFYIGTEPGKLEPAEAGFQDILERLRKEGLKETELSRGKNQIEGEYYRQHQSLGARANEAAKLALDGRSLAHNREMIENCRLTNEADIKKVIDKYLQKGREYTIRVLP